jgi:hypothetical protein
MFKLGPLKYQAIDGQNCTHPEQTYGCAAIPGKDGHYKLGLQVVYARDFLQKSVMTPDMLQRRITVARRQSAEDNQSVKDNQPTEPKTADSIFGARARQHMYPLTSSYGSALQINFEVDLVSPQAPHFLEIEVTQMHMPSLLCVSYEALDEEHKRGQSSPNMRGLDRHYRQMYSDGQHNRFLPPRGKNFTFAEHHTLAVTKLAQHALTVHLLDKNPDVPFLYNNPTERDHAVCSPRELQKHGRSILFTAPHRRVIDNLNMRQLLSIQASEMTCAPYERQTMAQFGKVLDDTLGLQEKVTRYVRGNRVVSALGDALQKALGSPR